MNAWRWKQRLGRATNPTPHELTSAPILHACMLVEYE
jgi:hypothetical protein